MHYIDGGEGVGEGAGEDIGPPITLGYHVLDDGGIRSHDGGGRNGMIKIYHEVGGGSTCT